MEKVLYALNSYIFKKENLNWIIGKGLFWFIQLPHEDYQALTKSSGLQ